MNHHVYVTTADDLKMSSGAESSYQTSSYYPATSSYQSQSSLDFSQGDDVKNDYLLIPSTETTTLHAMTANPSNNTHIKEHPAAVQADQMNAFIDSYFVEQHGASTSSDGRDDLLDDLSADIDGMSEMSEMRSDDLLMGDYHHDLKDLSSPLDLDGSELSDNYREDKARKRRAAAARLRYQRMTEDERRLYNHRRRLKQLGLDPESSRADMEQVQQHVKQANAKKAEAARLRYHRMTPEQKRDYNLRRTEAFRKRRQEEERLLSTPAGRISADALAKAQQIMVRNARKAESARLRYQRMTPDERKQYNLKRAAAKKSRRKPSPVREQMGQQVKNEYQHQPQMMHQQEEEQEELDNHNHQPEVIHHARQNGASTSYRQPETELVAADQETQEQHMLDIINEVATHSQMELAIFAQMEKDVVRRTKQAHAALQRQNENSMNISMVGETVGNAVSNLQSNAIVGGIQYDMAPPIEHELIVETASPVLPSSIAMTTPGGRLSNEQEMMMSDELGGVVADSSLDKQHQAMIDEKALHEMLRTGMDANGHPVEIRLPDGTEIRGLEQLSIIGQGQTILITPTTERKPLLATSSSGSYEQSSLMNNYASLSMNDQLQDSGISQSSSNWNQSNDYNRLAQAEPNLAQLSNAEKTAANRRKRAERARLRYHRMSVDERKEQNARRADMLRKSRQRDEHLCQLAETARVEDLDEATRQAIREAQERRAKRATQARAKYHRMDSEQRRQYNAMRDAQRRQRKREQDRLQHQKEMGGDPDDAKSSSMNTNSDVGDGMYHQSYDVYTGEAWDR